MNKTYIEGNEIILKSVFGAHLYGTETKDSDMDFKGIYLPKAEDLFLQRVKPHFISNTKTNPNLKNTKEDIDCEVFSLHEFINHAISGQTWAIDILHSPKNKWEIGSDLWEFIHNNRARFYSKNIKAFVGYAKTQASKYGIKGSRISDIKSVLGFLSNKSGETKLSEVWDSLPMGDNIKKYEYSACPQKDNRVYEVCARKLLATTPISKCAETLNKFNEAYGERARMSEESVGIDWKAISHAFRAAYQIKEILETGDLVFPLKERGFLVELKTQNTKQTLHYKNDGIGERLDSLIDDVNGLVTKSSFPEFPDRKFWESFILDIYKRMDSVLEYSPIAQW